MLSSSSPLSCSSPVKRRKIVNNLEYKLAKVDSRKLEEDLNKNKKEASAIAARLRLFLKQDQIDLTGSEHLTEICEVLVENEILERMGACKYKSKKRPSSQQQLYSGPIIGSKAYYNHPCDAAPSIKSLSLRLATQAANGTLGGSQHTKFELVSPEEMRAYQLQCFDNFMKRYHSFYDTFTTQC